MRKILIIARREYLERVRTRSFVLMTLLIPLLIYGGTVGPAMIMSKASGGTRHLIVVASDEKTADSIVRQLDELSHKSGGRDATGQRQPLSIGKLTVDVDTDTSDGEHAALIDKVQKKQVDGVIFATSSALAAKKVKFITTDVAGVIVSSELEHAVNDALLRDLLRGKGMSDAEVDSALQPVSLDATAPSGSGNPQAVFLTVMVAAMVLYVSLLLYGVNVMRAILDEKASRVMEVMLATAQAKELMAGKILGVAGVGLTQIAVWAAVILVPGTAIAAAVSAQGIISAKLLIYFAVFFVLGFTLYSTIYAAVGAMVNSEQEGQQLSLLVTLPIVLALVIMISTIQNPSSPVAVWASIFPLTAPLVMFMRVAITSPPLWQVVCSIVLTAATIYGAVWVCGRIYRVGILMYGKKPTLPEIMKWIRYA